MRNSEPPSPRHGRMGGIPNSSFLIPNSSFRIGFLPHDPEVLGFLEMVENG